jgi:hypothetical protein
MRPSSEQSHRPDPSEYPAPFKTYVDAVPEGDLLALLAEDHAVKLVAGVEEVRASSYAYAPGKWTIKQIVGHISDTERIFSYRALRIARGDETPLPGFEQDGYVDHAKANGRTLASLLEEFTAVRKATIALFESFEPEDWQRRGSASGYSTTVRGLAFALTGHERHHGRILRERYLT